ncbi:hypothetical protein EJ110_NYTH16702 [Nymphaea thermarum]|nr:hypothetical protein EJ110_NYTH16702 [Nymphaea thermarum]
MRQRQERMAVDEAAAGGRRTAAAGGKRERQERSDTSPNGQKKNTGNMFPPLAVETCFRKNYSGNGFNGYKFNSVGILAHQTLPEVLKSSNPFFKRVRAEMAKEEGKTVTVKSSDNEVLEVEEAVAKESQTI